MHCNEEQGWKKCFFLFLKLFVFFVIFKPKNLERSIFWFYGFLDINFFRTDFALKPYGYYFFIIILFSIYLNLHSFSVCRLILHQYE